MWFEIENVNSFDPDAEAAITLSGAMGQEESRNLSENIQWGIKRKFGDFEGGCIFIGGIGSKFESRLK